MKKFNDLKPMEQICLLIGIIFVTVLITLNLPGHDTKIKVKNIPYITNQDNWEDVKLKLRHKYVETKSGHWLFCINIYDNGTFAYSDNYGNFGYYSIGNIVAVSDLPQADN